jgi:hypothetical protein
MKNQLPNRLINQARWLVLAMGLSLAITARAAIAIQDGTPLTIPTQSGGTISKSFTVTAGASVLVVAVEDRSPANQEPATLAWIGGQTLTRDVQSLANSSTFRCMAMYHLYNPTPGTANIAGTVGGNPSSTWVAAYTLSGVDTTIPPLILQTNSGTSSTITTYPITTNVPVANSWAAFGAISGSISLTATITGTGGTTTSVTDNAHDGSTAIAGYIANLSAGADLIQATFSAGTKAGFGVLIFAPAPPSPPVITTQPTWSPSTVHGQFNESATATVVATGTAPFFYYWYTNNTTTPHLTDSANHIIGSATSALTITNDVLADGQNYFVVVSNSLGSVTSAPAATLTFTPTAPSITTQPSWSPATNYAVFNPTTKATVVASGTAPLSYLWFTNSTTTPALTDSANHVSGSISNVLVISNAVVSDSLNYMVVITNVYGSVTSSVAALTVLPVQPATNFTFNFGGAPIVQGSGGNVDWNTVNQWNPGGLAATNSMIAYPGSSFEVVTGALLRSPSLASGFGSNYFAFPGVNLTLDGNGVFTNNSGGVSTVGQIKFKEVLNPTTNYFPLLTMAGGQLNNGGLNNVNFEQLIVIQGTVNIVSNTPVYSSDGTTNRPFQIDAYLEGNGSIEYHDYTNWDAGFGGLIISGNTNTYSGTWNVVQGPLLGSGTNSLGTNTITIGANGVLETTYPINNTNSSLILNGRMFLTQTDAFHSVIINGTQLAPGTYSAATLFTNFPTSFPTNFVAFWGAPAGATNASGQITVLSGPSTIALSSSAQPSGYLGAVTFTAAVQANAVTAVNATGTVTFSTTNGVISISPVSGGSASSASVSSLPRGTNLITAIYSGDSSYFSSTNTLNQIVTNHPPVAQNISLGALSGTPVTLQIIGGKYAPTDVDGDTLLVSAVQNPSAQGGAVTTDGTNVTYTALGSYAGTDTFTYSVSDGFGGIVTNTITANVVANGAGFNLVSGPVNNGNGTSSITYAGIPGYQYALETTPSLTPPITWTPVITNTANATNGQLGFTFSTAAGQGFFRTHYVP